MTITIRHRRYTPFFSSPVVVVLFALAVEPSAYFTDVTTAAGIHFRHVNGAYGDHDICETYGSGVAFFDYDNDDDLDLYFVNSGPLNGPRGKATNVLYRNDGDGTFSDVTASALVAGASYGMGVVAADYDNDGDQDLYLTNLGPNILYRNNGDGTFSDVSREAGVADTSWGSSAAFVDYDNDGDLDLYVVNYVVFNRSQNVWCGRKDLNLRMYCDPRTFKPAPDVLYRNNGDGTFSDVSRQAGITDLGNGLGVACADYDNDGDQDIYVANDMHPNALYKNLGNGRFREIGLLSGTALSAEGLAQAGMGVDWGDYDNDGDLDIVVTNFELENNCLYRNDGHDTFSEVSFPAGIGAPSLRYLGFGAGFFDYDNDGLWDLFVANGHVHDNIARVDRASSYAQPPQLFRNVGNGRFTEVTARAGPVFAGRYVGRGVAFGDYDKDGDSDVVVSCSNDQAHLFRNDVGHRSHWLRVRPVGTKSNRDAVGSRVSVVTAKRTLTAEVRAGASYQSSNERTLTFGLGEATSADRLTIRWPSGTTLTLSNVRADTTLVITEPVR
jgi:hypothetical protein